MGVERSRLAVFVLVHYSVSLPSALAPNGLRIYCISLLSLSGSGFATLRIDCPLRGVCIHTHRYGGVEGPAEEMAFGHFGGTIGLGATVRVKLLEANIWRKPNSNLNPKPPLFLPTLLGNQTNLGTPIDYSNSLVAYTPGRGLRRSWLPGVYQTWLSEICSHAPG